MTVEHRLVVGLGDIRAVTLECKHCGARLSHSPEGLKRGDLWKCPSCHRDWLSDSLVHSQRPTSDLALFLLTLSASRKTQQEGTDSAVGVRVFLEFDAPCKSHV